MAGTVVNLPSAWAVKHGAMVTEAEAAAKAMLQIEPNLSVTRGRLGVILVDVTAPLGEARTRIRELRVASETGRIEGLLRAHLAMLTKACSQLQEILRSLDLAIALLTSGGTPEEKRQEIAVAWLDMQAELEVAIFKFLQIVPRQTHLRAVPPPGS